jgi:hypothetical protein|tara:strand:- start:1084 stop:1602 length:519 start_codon:yes stop_codon:yes gene_type:complete
MEHTQHTPLTDSALQTRLNAEPIIEKLRVFLSGEYPVITYDGEGKAQVTYEQTGEPKANKRGVQAILSYVSSVINPQTVQGNFIDMKHYDDYIFDVHTTLARTIMINLVNWEINIYDYSLITGQIMHLIIPFMSRLIDNKERDSYTNTIRSFETSTIHSPHEKHGLFERFKK